MSIARLAVAALLSGTALTFPNAGIANGGFNNSGNILISDQFNNRVIEVTKKGKIV